jgi:hypothetical protein
MYKKETYKIFLPDEISNIWAKWLHPVAKYLPSGENFTQQTTLYRKIENLRQKRSSE